MKENARKLYESFISENGFVPPFAYCDVTFKDDNTTLNALIQLSYSENDDDTFVFFYCSDIDELLSLFDKDNGEDFYISELNYFCE